MTATQVAIAMEPLRQIDGSLGRKFEGMGLGLPLASGIAELHGGNLTIDSQLDNGTAVTIVVPVGQKAENAQLDKCSLPVGPSSRQSQRGQSHLCPLLVTPMPRQE